MFEEPYIADAITGVLLLLAAHRSWRCWQLRRPHPGGWFWLIAAVGLVALTMDEWLGLHERVGEDLLPEITWLNHSDDLIMMLYASAAAGIVALFFREITASHRVAVLLAGAIAATALAALTDGFGPDDSFLVASIEEGAENDGCRAGVPWCAVQAAIAA